MEMKSLYMTKQGELLMKINYQNLNLRNLLNILCPIANLALSKYKIIMFKVKVIKRLLSNICNHHKSKDNQSKLEIY